MFLAERTGNGLRLVRKIQARPGTLFREPAPIILEECEVPEGNMLGGLRRCCKDISGHRRSGPYQHICSICRKFTKGI